MAAEISLKIVREILSVCNSAGDAETASRVPSMVRVLSQNLNHSDRRVRSAAVSAFAAMVRNYPDSLGSANQYISDFDLARSNLSENTNDGDLEQLEILNSALEKLGFAPVANDDEYLDGYMQPDYAEEKKKSNRLHGMILRLGVAQAAAKPEQINAAVVQMRMVMVAGVISASLRLESHEAAEDDEGSTIAKIFLSVKVAPSDDDFVHDLGAAISDATDGRFKLANVDFWETHKSGKETPAETMEKSTEFADSEFDDENMYLDDDDKLASRVLGRKKAASKRKPWSMFNPSRALGLNSVFNADGLLEMIEYDCDEAKSAREQKILSPKVPEEPKAGRFGLFKRLFG